ncbi:MAG TPA: hypothetical protein VJV03_18210 [Pyrinomonadaceae bacterium]|nr:hypothetical protein [Pyrinomonadaceae bacterium]
MPNSPLSRPHYLAGKLLTADDFHQEQTYVIEKFKRHNRSLHGFGVVFGLRATTGAGKIKISAGMALDCEGNEIIIPSEQTLPPPAFDSKVAFITVKYSEHCEGVVPTDEPAAIVESVEFIFTTDNQNKGHRHLKARWLTCGKVHGLTLAKLRKGQTGWQVDRSYRTPQIK